MRISLVLAAMLLAMPASAQDQGARPDEEPADVTVVGRENRDKQVRDFVYMLSGRSAAPMARFDRTPLCPVATGLPDAQNAAVVARMRRIAQVARIDLAAPGCRGNVLVIVAPDKEVVIKEIRRTQPAYFYTTDDRMRLVSKQPGPAIAWHVEGQVDRGGAVISSKMGTLNRSPIPLSRISAGARPIFLAAVVVIETDAALGLDTTQLADYAAMRAYAGVDPARLKRAGDAPTILTALDRKGDPGAPLSLTRWDLAYLRALYATVKDSYAADQRLQIERDMRTALSRDARD